MEHYGVRERALQWRSRQSKRDIPNVFHVALTNKLEEDDRETCALLYRHRATEKNITALLKMFIAMPLADDLVYNLVISRR